MIHPTVRNTAKQPPPARFLAVFIISAKPMPDFNMMLSVPGVPNPKRVGPPRRRYLRPIEFKQELREWQDVSDIDVFKDQPLADFLLHVTATAKQQPLVAQAISSGAWAKCLPKLRKLIRRLRAVNIGFTSDTDIAWQNFRDRKSI